MPKILKGIDYLHKYLKEKKIKHTAFAALMGCHKVTLSRMMMGRQDVSVVTAKRIEEITEGAVLAVDLLDVRPKKKPPIEPPAEPSKESAA